MTDKKHMIKQNHNKTSLIILPKKIGIILYAMAMLVSPSTFAQSFNSYFKAMETEMENLAPFNKWTGQISRFDDQREVPDSECGEVRFHPCEIKSWKELLETLKDKPLDEQLKQVNSWANKHPYIIDQLNWGLNDYWATTYEFMEMNGDCEDYAIAKYYSLRALGIPEDKLRVMVVQDYNLGGIIHAVLGVYDDDHNLIILDNQIKHVIPAMKIYHYRPIYAVNESNWFTYK